MSSRDHHCPRCQKDWHCEGCDSRNETRLCDACRGIYDQWHEIVTKAFEGLAEPVTDREYEGEAIRAYFKALGCSVDFISGEVRDEATGQLRAHMGSWKKEKDGSLTVSVQLCHAINFLPVSVVVSQTDAPTGNASGGSSL